MERKTLGLKLLDLRQQHHLTQQQLCEALNIGRSTYSYFETGRRIPDIDTLLLIAQYYNVSVDYLVTASTGTSALPAGSSPDAYSDVQLVHHLKAKHIPIESVLELSKTDFDFLKIYKELTEENKEELRYLMNYKMRRQKTGLPDGQPDIPPKK